MLNKIVTDSDLNVQLVINLQEPRTFDDTWANSIIIEIDADDTANQRLIVDAGSAGSTSYPVTAGQINEIEIETEYWNMSGASAITLRKGSTSYGTITINFPDEIDSLGMLNQEENIETVFNMTGSYNDTTDIANKVDDVSSRVEDLQDNKQNYIDQDILIPSTSASEGDLCFYGVTGNSHKKLYRYENNAWLPILWGNGGGNIGTTVLYANPNDTVEQTITLDDDFNNYTMLMVGGHNGLYRNNVIYITDELQVNMKIGAYDNANYCWYTIIDGTTLQVDANYNMIVSYIYGVN